MQYLSVLDQWDMAVSDVPYYGVLAAVVYIISCLILLAIGKVGYQLFHRHVNVPNELVEKDNLAFSFAYAGYFVGLLAVIGGALLGPSEGLFSDVYAILVYGFIGVILLNVSLFLNDMLIFRKFKVSKEILEDQNAGTGIAVAGCSVATGVVIMGALMGEGAGVLSALIAWVLGQVILWITARIYNLLSPYDIHEYIEKDNVAVGIGFSGALIAIGLLVNFSIKDDFMSFKDYGLNILYTTVIGLAILPVLRWLTDKILLPGQKLTDEIINQEDPNNGAALLEAFAYIGGAVILTWCL